MDGAFPSQKGEPFENEEFRGERKGFRGTVENSKTKICMRWKNGHCRFGDRCNFAHGEAELRKLPPRGEAYSPDAGQGRGRRGYSYGGGYSEGFGATQVPPSRIPGSSYFDSYRGSYGGGYSGAPGSSIGGIGAPSSFPGPHGAAPSGDMQGVQEGSSDLWAAQGYPIPGPNSWTQYRAPETGEPYYHNRRTGETTWDKPPEWGP